MSWQTNDTAGNGAGTNPPRSLDRKNEAVAPGRPDQANPTRAAPDGIPLNALAAFDSDGDASVAVPIR